MAEITEIGKNCQSWKYNIKLVLMERGLWSFVEGNQEVPTEDTTAAVIRNSYRLRSDKAYSLIALSECREVHISTTTDPKISWDTLKSQGLCSKRRICLYRLGE